MGGLYVRNVFITNVRNVRNERLNYLAQFYQSTQIIAKKEEPGQDYLTEHPVKYFRANPPREILESEDAIHAHSAATCLYRPTIPYLSQPTQKIPMLSHPDTSTETFSRIPPLFHLFTPDSNHFQLLCSSRRSSRHVEVLTPRAVDVNLKIRVPRR